MATRDPGAAGRLREQMMTSEAAVPTSTLGRMWRTGRGAIGLTGALLRGRKGQEIDMEAIAGVVRGLGGLKGMGMKVGQMIGYVDQSVPEELREMLSLLQTSAPATAFAAVEATLREALGERAELLLAGLERAPVAVASIGQVHRGTLPDGTEVAVKVRHPGVKEALVADFRAAGIGKLFGALAGGATIPDTIDEARAAFIEECDFRREAERQRIFGRLFADDPVLRVPAVLDAWSSERVLVTRWTPGRSLDRFLADKPRQAERDAVGEALFRFWMRTLYREGLFHGDPHPGNFAICADGLVVVYDFGCVRSFDAPVRRGFARLAAATRDDDLDAMVAAIAELGGQAPKDAAGRAHLRELLRSFFGLLLKGGRRRVAADEGHAARDLMRDKRAILGLRLPGRMLFLFRLRFGLHAVLARLQAEVDWCALEGQWAREA